MRHLRHAVLVLAVLPGLASAGDVYVDPVGGDDAADGTSAKTAWRTLRFALDRTNGPKAHTIHLLPGVHADAGPLEMTDSLTLVGTKGAEATSIEIDRLQVRPSGGVTAAVNLIDLTLRGATGGIEAIAPNVATEVSIRLDRVRIEGGQYGIFAVPDVGRRAVIEARDLTIDASGIGVRMERDVALTLEDSAVIDCDSVGIDAGFLVGTPLALAGVVVRRSRVVGTAGVGVRVGGGFVDVTIEDSLVADNGGIGVHARSLIGGFAIDRTTIVGSGGRGLFIQTGAPMASLTDSIVALSGTQDVRLVGVTLDLRDTLVEDGSATGPGVLAGDPLFVDPAADDYRLRPTSPAVDRLAALDVADLFGNSRDVDGDFDRDPARDLGAIESRAFRALGPAVAGTPLALEVLGPEIGIATIAVAPAPLVTPAMSPYGAIALDRTVAWRAMLVGLPGGGEPTTTSVALPAVAVGETWGLQTWIPSSASPTGAAFSNAIEIVIE